MMEIKRYIKIQLKVDREGGLWSERFVYGQQVTICITDGLTKMVFMPGQLS